MIKFILFLFSTVICQSVITWYLWNLLVDRHCTVDFIWNESKNTTGIITIVGLLYNSVTVLFVSIFFI